MRAWGVAVDFHCATRERGSLRQGYEAGVTAKQRDANLNTRNKSWNTAMHGSKSRATLYTHLRNDPDGRAI